MSDSIGMVYLDIGVNQSQLNSTLMGLGKQTTGGVSKAFNGAGISGMLTKIGGLAAGAFAVKAIAGFATSSIKLGSDLAEVQNVVDVTYGSMSASVSAWAQNAMTEYGLSETAAKRYTGTMGAMLKSMGVGIGTAADMSQNIAGLAGDFASFYNLDSEEAFMKIRSGISGETEPLRQLGINMSVANLEAYAMTQGITGSYQAMGQANQALLRYNYLMSVSADAQGDFARTSSSWANQTRILKLQWDSFKASFGQGLINLFAPILVGINKVMSGLMKLGGMFSAFTGALFGTQKAAGGLNQQLSDIANSGADAAAGQTDASAATKAAGKAAKGILAPFDQLNIMQEATADAGSGVAGGPGVGSSGLDAGQGGFAAPAAPAIDTSGIEASVAKLKGFFNFQNIITSWANLKTALTPLSETIFSGLAWFWNNILVPLGKWAISSLVPSFLNLLAGAATLLNGVLVVLQPLGLWLWETFLKPIAKWTGGVIVSVLTGIGDGLSIIGDWIKKHQELVQIIAIAIGSFALAWGLVNAALGIWNVIGIVATAVTTGFGAAVAFLTSPIFLVTLAIAAVIAIVVLLIKYWDKIVPACQIALNWLMRIFSNVVNWISKNVIVPIGNFFKKLWNTITGAFNSVGSFFSRVFTAGWTAVKNAFNSVRTFFSGIWNTIKGVFNAVGSFFSTAFSSGWTAVKNAFNSVRTFFSGIWDSIKSIFGTIGSVIGDAVSGAFKTVVNSIIRFAEGAINGFIRAINFAIGLINGALGWTGVNVKTVKELSIPRLATGGIVSQPTLAMVGDNRRSSEVVAPLHELMGMIQAAVGSSGNPDSVKLLSEMVGLLKIVAGKDPNVLVQVADHSSPAAARRANLRAGRTIIPVGG